MASQSQSQIGVLIGGGRLVGKQQMFGEDGSSSFDPTTTQATVDVSTLRNSLSTIGGAVYTDAYMNTMTFNDMVFALVTSNEYTI